MNQQPQPGEAKAIQVQWNSGKVVFTPADQDRFVMEAKAAISSCQGQIAFDRFWRQFQDEFLARLRQWCERRAAKVTSCYAMFPTGSDIRVFMIGATERFDFDLSDQISDLESELDQLGWQTDIIQLPAASPETHSSFFNLAHSIQVYGDGSRASVQGST